MNTQNEVLEAANQTLRYLLRRNDELTRECTVLREELARAKFFARKLQIRNQKGQAILRCSIAALAGEAGEVASFSPADDNNGDLEAAAALSGNDIEEQVREDLNGPVEREKEHEISQPEEKHGAKESREIDVINDDTRHASGSRSQDDTELQSAPSISHRPPDFWSKLGVA